MIIVHMKNYTEKKKKSDVFHLTKTWFFWEYWERSTQGPK